LKAKQHCRACLEGLGRRIALAACPSEEILRRRAEAAAAAVLDRHFRVGRSVPTRLASRMLRAVSGETGNPDPFRRAKEEEFRRGSDAAARLTPRFSADLEGALAFSALGNRIDFFRDLGQVEKEWENAGGEKLSGDLPALLSELRPGVSVLVLADNTGEVPFDLPLLRRLANEGMRVRYAVKGRPSQNDVTAEDLAHFGLAVEGLVDTGTGWVGCELLRVGESFREAWEEADVVLAKGMANLETLTEYPGKLACKRVFFLLVAKCPPVAEFVGLEEGQAGVFDASKLPSAGGGAW
jgi:uncharacterized protein with ATP-grasp and redox domains